MNGARREAILRAAKAVFAEKGLLVAFMSLTRQIDSLFLVSFRTRRPLRRRGGRKARSFGAEQGAGEERARCHRGGVTRREIW